MKARITISFVLFFAFAGFLFSQSLSNHDNAKSSSYVDGEYYVESFEGDVFPPEGWQIFQLDGMFFWDAHPYSGYKGAKCAYVNYAITTCLHYEHKEGKRSLFKTDCYNGYTPDTTDNWLVSPRFSAALTDSLIFYISPYYYTGEKNNLYVRISTSAQVPSDSASLYESFSDMLIDVRIDTLPDSWTRCSVPLAKYAGKDIYIGFQNHCVDGTGLKLDNIKIGAQPDIDIAALFYDVSPYCKIGDKISLKGTFSNFGKETKSFYAVCEIPGENYINEKYYENVAPDSIISVQFDSASVKTGGPHNAIFYIKTNGDENPLNDTAIAKFYPIEELSGAKWSLEPDFPGTHGSSGFSSYSKNSDTTFIYMIGGGLSYGVSDSIYIYNTATRKWSAANATLPKKLSQITTAQIGGKIYIPGGYDDDINNYSSSLYIYDIKSDQISQGAELLNSYPSYALGVYHDSLLYVIGSMRDSSVQIYNTFNNTWKYGNNAPWENDNYYRTGGLAGNKIVLTGWSNGEGITSIGVIDKNNPYNISWSVIPYPGSYAAKATFGSWDGIKYKYVFFAGGGYTLNYINEVWIYDVVHDIWLSGPDKINASQFQSGMTPVIRNDSVFMAATGGRGLYDFEEGTHEWLYIGIDKPDTIYIATEDEPNITAPKEYSLSQNYPNPFNPSTTIRYALPKSGYVDIKVYNMLGQEVKTLVNEYKNAGTYEVKFNAAGLNLSSGIYLYRIKSGEFVQTKKLMLIK